MAEIAKPVLSAVDVVDNLCPHCATVTAQVIPQHVQPVSLTPSGLCDFPFLNTCLQCIADGGTCCSLSIFNRWAAPSEPAGGAS